MSGLYQECIKFNQKDNGVLRLPFRVAFVPSIKKSLATTCRQAGWIRDGCSNHNLLNCLSLELAEVQMMIEALLGQQFLVGALLDDLRRE
jgi:hypothetical protein